MNKFIFLILLTLSNLSLANLNSQNETIDTNNRLLENLLAGVDLTINNLDDSKLTITNPDSSYFISVQLVAIGNNKDKNQIELFRTDDFTQTSEAQILNKEYYIKGTEVFKILEPHMTTLENSEKIKIKLTLNERTKSNISNRKVSQDDDNTLKYTLNEEALSKDSYKLFYR